MEDQPVHVIRESTRSLLKLNRQHHRDEASDGSRGIEELKISPEIVSEIAQKLKTKTSITASDLNTLKNALMEDSNSRSIVLNTHGALRGLVRELTVQGCDGQHSQNLRRLIDALKSSTASVITDVMDCSSYLTAGHQITKQCAAAGCLCNLALEESRACSIIAKASGSYLIAALDNLTTELAETCAWTLGNLAGAGPAAGRALQAGGAPGRLRGLLGGGGGARRAAGYALVHFAYQLRDDFRVEYLNEILQVLAKTKTTMSSCQLLFILSCHKHFSEYITEGLLQNVLDDLQATLETHLVTCKQNDLTDKHNYFCCKLIYLIRVLANIELGEVHIVVINYFVTNNLGGKLSKVLELNNRSINNSLLWLLGNLFNYCSDSVFFSSFVVNNVS